ncbi:unnamed protein product [Nyctereutes procyonoides]|uniref:60S ribosomal protein L7a n=1 Tax=Nyctereutes procyonoides TaxID=34880 RepID=A0A811Z1Y9_NYCPR|nr:unnamed protein product [Nyctereutes procyonoides]
MPSKMLKRKKAKWKKMVPASAVMNKKEVKKVVNFLFEKSPKDFGIGRDIQCKRDLTYFVKWPCYIWLQQQRALLYKHLKVPPTINQFTQALNTKKEKKQRLLAQTEKKAASKGDVNTVTTLVENKKVQLVMIAHDTGVPYCIIKGEARLRHLVHRKTYTTVTFTQYNLENKRALVKLVEAIRTNYNDRYKKIHRHWGGIVQIR